MKNSLPDVRCTRSKGKFVALCCMQPLMHDNSCFKKYLICELYNVFYRCFIGYFCPQGSAKPADWKYQSALSASWLSLGCTVNVNIHIPLLATSPNHDLEKNTKVSNWLHQSCHYFSSFKCYLKLLWSIASIENANSSSSAVLRVCGFLSPKLLAIIMIII